MKATSDGSGFHELLNQLARGYVPRRGAEEAVTAALKSVGSGCVIVAGEPGSGKSALAAHLITSNGWSCHFLRTGHTEFSLWRDPHAFLTSVAFQLQAAFGDEIFPESVAITVNGTVQDVAASGAVVGVDIKQLIALPWRRERVAVDLKVRKIAGDVTGVQIGELVENYRSVPLSAFRDVALLDPLRRLRQLRPDARFTLWVDGLDEELGVVREPDGNGAAAPSIGRLLPLHSECRALGNVTLVVSSRRGPHLDRLLEDGATLVELDAPELADDTARVLTALIDRELADAAINAALDALGWPAADVRAGLLERSDGNFLFLRQYFEAVRAGHGAALRDGGLPRGLDEIHARILSTMLRSVVDLQRPDVIALLEVLAVAETPLSEAQLARFTGTTALAVKAALQTLRSLLEETANETPVRFAVYHKSLRDCLLDLRHAKSVWHVDAVRAHRRIAQAYFEPDGSPSQFDGYGVLHLATHLAHGGPEGNETLMGLLHDGWRKFCREATGSNRVFRQGLDLARRNAGTLAPAEACVRLIRLALADVYVRSAESQIPADALEIMVRLGQVQRALDSVPEGLEPVELARRYAAIIRGLLASPAGDATLAARLLLLALGKLKQRADWLETEIVAMLDEWPLEKAGVLRDAFPELEAAVLQTAPGSAAALATFARLRTVLHPADANARLQQAFDAVRSTKPPDAAAIIGRLFSVWARFDPAAARAHLQTRGSFPTTAESAAAFMELSRAIEKAGWQDSLAQGAQLLLSVPLEPDRDPLEPAAIWLQIVLAVPPKTWHPQTAAQITDRVQGVLAQVRSSRLASDKPRGASSDETALLIGIADAERACQRGRETQALNEAWEAVLEGAAVAEVDLARLVRLQASTDPEVLEAYLNTAPAPLRDRLWFAAVRENLLPSRNAAKTLDRLVLASEKPRATGWSFFFFSLIENSPADQLDRCEQLAHAMGVRPAFIVRWRITILRRLLAEGHPRVAEWLDTTVRLWAGPQANRNFIEELPAALEEIPEHLLGPTEASLQKVTNRSQRALLRAALAARIWFQDSGRARAEFNEAAKEAVAPPEPSDNADYVTLAFVAGQMFRCDPVAANAAWADAIGRLEARIGAPAEGTPSAQGHHVHLCMMLRMLQWGAPEIALPKLAALREPPLEPGVRMMMMPFPSVSPFRVANLGEHEFLIGSALVRALPNHPQLVREITAGPLTAAARAFSFSQLAQFGNGATIPQRLAWSQQSFSAALEVENPPLRHLLTAEAARASFIAGARKRALEIAQAVVPAMESHFPQADTVTAHSFASALGRCIAVAIRCEAWDTAWHWLWLGRTLGMHGFHVMLGDLPAAMSATAPVTIERFEMAEASGRNFYVLE